MKKSTEFEVPELGLELRQSDSRNPAFDLNGGPSLPVYETVYSVAAG